MPFYYTKIYFRTLFHFRLPLAETSLEEEIFNTEIYKHHDNEIDDDCDEASGNTGMDVKTVYNSRGSSRNGEMYCIY